jgi:hypothetical protein
MKLVIPVSRHDRHLIPAFLKSIKTFNPGSEHELLVFGSREVESDVLEIEAKIKHLFNLSETLIIDDTMLGWPMSCNFYFQQLCRYISGKKDIDSFMWFELDTTIMKNNWLDIISDEYYSDTTKAVKEKREPAIYLGSRERVYEGRNGELLPESLAGQRMAPVGVYSKEICFSHVLNSLSMVNRHWTHVIQWYVVKRLKNSSLIQNNWRTKNYRHEDKNIVCDSDANLAWDVHWNKPVDEGAVLVHGCKDGSLFKLLLDNNNDDMKMVKNLSVEDAEDILDDIEDVTDSDVEKHSKLHRQRILSIKSLKKKQKEKEE